MKRLLQRLIREVGDDGVADAAAGVAFWLLLSLPALALTALSAVSVLGEEFTDTLRTNAIDFIDRVFADQSDTLEQSIDELFDQGRPGVFSVAIAVAIFTVSRSFAGLIRALDTVYDVEETRNFVHTRLLGIGLALGTLAVTAGVTALWSVTTDAGWALGFRLMIGVGVLVLWAATMYHVAPNHHTPWRYDIPGALLTAVGWVVLSAGFGWYVSIVGDGNQFVGATGALLLGLTWLWAVCVVFLIGGELNQILAERADVIRESRSLVDRATEVARQRLEDFDWNGSDEPDSDQPDSDAAGETGDAGEPERPV